MHLINQEGNVAFIMPETYNQVGQYCAIQIWSDLTTKNNPSKDAIQVNFQVQHRNVVVPAIKDELDVVPQGSDTLGTFYMKAWYNALHKVATTGQEPGFDTDAGWSIVADA